MNYLMSYFMNMSCRLIFTGCLKNNCTVCECHLMYSYIFIFSAELMSSNKKYAPKQRQYKLFAGMLVYFRTFFVPPSHCYHQKRSTYG